MRRGPPCRPSGADRNRRPQRLELGEAESARSAAVEQLKPRQRRLPEFRQGDAAVEIGIGGRDGFGQVEQPIARGALKSALGHDANLGFIIEALS